MANTPEERIRELERLGPPRSASESAVYGWVGSIVPQNLTELGNWLQERLRLYREMPRNPHYFRVTGHGETPTTEWTTFEARPRNVLARLGWATGSVAKVHRWLEHHGVAHKPAWPPEFQDQKEAERQLSELLSWLRSQAFNPAAATTERSAADIGREVKREYTGKGDAEAKIIGFLTKHHRYGETPINQECIAVTDLAETARVGKASVSRFFRKEFGVNGFASYRAVCGNIDKLMVFLRKINGELPTRLLLTGIIPDSDRRMNRD